MDNCKIIDLVDGEGKYTHMIVCALRFVIIFPVTQKFIVAILSRMLGRLITKPKTNGMSCIPKIPASRKHGWMRLTENGNEYKMMHFQVSNVAENVVARKFWPTCIHRCADYLENNYPLDASQFS